jgi:hypothetical protein
VNTDKDCARGKKNKKLVDSYNGHRMPHTSNTHDLHSDLVLVVILGSQDEMQN